MLLQGTWSWKTLVTLCALECLLSCVSPLKKLHQLRVHLFSLIHLTLRSSFGALEHLLSTVTFHETLPVVGSLMFLHVMWPWKLLATPWAQKLFLSCVDFSFFTMVTWSQEHHATLFASKLFLSCDDERTHMGGKPFKCTKCDKSCPLSSYLKAHEKIHSGEKPFKCTNCNKSCSTSSYLNTHPLRRDSI